MLWRAGGVCGYIAPVPRRSSCCCAVVQRTCCIMSLHYGIALCHHVAGVEPGLPDRGLPHTSPPDCVTDGALAPWTSERRAWGTNDSSREHEAAGRMGHSGNCSQDVAGERAPQHAAAGLANKHKDKQGPQPPARRAGQSLTGQSRAAGRTTKGVRDAGAAPGGKMRNRGWQARGRAAFKRERGQRLLPRAALGLAVVAAQEASTIAVLAAPAVAVACASTCCHHIPWCTESP